MGSSIGACVRPQAWIGVWQRVAMSVVGGNPDFNRPVTLQIGAEPTKPSPHKSVMEMETFFKKFYGETPTAPHSQKFKPDAKAWYQHTLLVTLPDNKSKKKAKAKAKSSGRD